MQTRILVADDNAEIREILRILLTGEGYEVIEAKDGNEVLQLFDSSIDLIEYNGWASPSNTEK